MEVPKIDPHYKKALTRLKEIPTIPLVNNPTSVEEMAQLRSAIGYGPRLFIKRDDAIPFGFGGNKIRKLETVAAEALSVGADTLITMGGTQSNHARATATVAAKSGLDCHLILNGQKPEQLTGNTLLDELLAAEIMYVDSRDDRLPTAKKIAKELKSNGQKPYLIPIGASTPLGALGFVQAIGEMLEQIPAPDVIFHASSSGGTQAGLAAGCVLHGLDTRIVGISADDPAKEIKSTVQEIVEGMDELLGCDGNVLANDCRIEIDDTFVGEGYGAPTSASQEAQRLAAQTEGFFVDHTYTAKALAGLISYIREGHFDETQTVLFWHTGGQPGLFA